jgi:hypothetical protein
MKNILILLSITLLLTGCSTTTKNKHSEPKSVYLGLAPDAFAVVADDLVKFYSITENELEERAFLLPKGYSSVVGFNLVNLGVIIGNTMYYYSYYPGRGWEEIPSHKFVLPAGYKSVVGFDQNTMGVIVDNKLIFYHYFQPWIERLRYDFILPNGYKSIIGLAPYDFNDSIGVVVGNKLKHCIFDDGHWQFEELEFTLPDDYSGVIGLHINAFGVVVGNRVEIYQYWDDEKGFVLYKVWTGFTLE